MFMTVVVDDIHLVLHYFGLEQSLADLAQVNKLERSPRWAKSHSFRKQRESLLQWAETKSRACRTRLRSLEVRVGVGEDPFPKLKGLITNLINRLPEVQAVKCKEQE